MRCSTLRYDDDSLWCKRHCETVGSSASRCKTGGGWVFRSGRPGKIAAQHKTYGHDGQVIRPDRNSQKDKRTKPFVRILQLCYDIRKPTEITTTNNNHEILKCLFWNSNKNPYVHGLIEFIKAYGLHNSDFKSVFTAPTTH